MAYKDSYYKEFPKDLLRKIKKSRKEIEKAIKRDGGVVLELNSCYKNLSYELIRKQSIIVSEKYKGCVFLFVPNIEGTFVPVVKLDGLKRILLMFHTKSDNFSFFEDNFDKRHKIKSKCEKLFYPYLAVIEGKGGIVLLDSQIKPELLGTEFEFNALKIPKPVYDEKIKLNYMKDFYLMTETKPVELDFEKIPSIIKKINDIQDLSFVWDYYNNRPMYTDLEVALIIGNIFFAERGTPAMNMILAGKTGSKKTPWLSVLSWITGDEIYSGRHLTLKGLIPSWYGERVSIGAFFSSKYCTIVDEFFRVADEHALRIGFPKSLGNVFSGLMNIFDRVGKSYSSGKGKEQLVFTNSCLFTDNFYHTDALRELAKTDEASLRRVSWLITSDKTNEIAGSSRLLNEKKFEEYTMKRFANIFGKNPKYSLRLLFKYMRKIISDVEFNDRTLQKITMKYQTESNKEFLASKSEPLMKIAVILNHVIYNTEKLKAVDRDYKLFEKLIERIASDRQKILSIKKLEKLKFSQVDFKGDRV